jgi:hypothetical protein
MKRLMASLTIIGILWPPAGCGGPPAYTVCLVDVSRSITAVGLRAEFNAVDDLVGRMRRGDRLTIIPITSNAISETPGHVLTLAAPIARQPYDYDLVEFRANAQMEIAMSQKAFADRPSKHTDILGAIAIAREELASAAEDARPPFGSLTLYVFSDFIEDDGTYRFGSEAEAGRRREAAEFARRLQCERHTNFPASVRVRLVEVESSELARIRPERQRWIRAFWEAYFLPYRPQWTQINAVHGGSQ